MTIQDATLGNDALILCVEDEDVLRRDIAEELSEAGYRVIEAATGEEALQQCEVARPDLILCDICMPGMDGYGLLRTLQSQPDGPADIPFLFLSALSGRRDIVEGKLLGADDYLTKPVDFDLLLATVHARLRQIYRIRSNAELPGGVIEAQFNALSRKGGDPGYTAVLDMLSIAIVLVGSNREVCFVNRSARDLAQSCAPLRIALDSCSASGRRKAGFTAWLDEMLDQPSDRKISSFIFPVDDHADELKMVGCHLGNQGETSPRLALFITRSGTVSELSTAPLTEMFGFTPTECLIAAALANGERPAEIAESLNIAQTTVAFHMRNIFQKTGVGRQASLVALLLASPAGFLTMVE